MYHPLMTHVQRTRNAVYVVVATSTPLISSLSECTTGTLSDLRRGLLADTLSSWIRKLDCLEDAVKSYYNREETAFYFLVSPSSCLQC